MKTITLKDAMTGEDLKITFDLKMDTMQINGKDVERKRALESNENEFVYGPIGSGPSVLYHLSKDQIEQMRKL